MKNSLVKIAQKTLNYFGYEITPIWKLEHLEIASHLRDLFRFLDIKCVLDVGANKGQYRDFLRQHVAYEGLILSFEPISLLAEHLRTRAGTDSNWEVFPFALGSSDKTLAINVMRSNQFSSFLMPDHTVIKDYKDTNTVDHQEVVSVRQLDTLMGELKRKWRVQNIYLKLDTQGFDLEVIKGAEKILGDVFALQSEVSVQRIYSGMPDYLSTMKLLGEKNFDITGMFPVNRDQCLRVVEFDCVAVNRSVIVKSE